MSTEQLRIICLVLLLVFGGLYFYTDRQQGSLEHTAKPAAEQLLTEISSWDKQILLERLSTEARATLDDQQLTRLIEHYQQFGTLQSIQEMQFSKVMSALSLFGSNRISYQGTAIYSSGPANFTMTIVPFQDTYLIYNFAISR